MTTTQAAGVRWIEVRKDRSYRVESPIGDYTVYREFASHIWTVYDETGENMYEANSFEKCFDVIAEVAAESAE